MGVVGGSVKEGGEGKKLGVRLVRSLASLPHTGAQKDQQARDFRDSRGDIAC